MHKRHSPIELLALKAHTHTHTSTQPKGDTDRLGGILSSATGFRTKFGNLMAEFGGIHLVKDNFFYLISSHSAG